MHENVNGTSKIFSVVINITFFVINITKKTFHMFYVTLSSLIISFMKFMDRNALNALNKLIVGK